MKTRVKFSVIILLLLTVTASSQVPEKFNYQAVARDASGTLLINKVLDVRISILSSLSPETVLWEEEHQVTSNDFGMFFIEIGTGTKTGGTMTSFSDIEWGQTLYIKPSLRQFGANWQEMETSGILSVPTALVAKKVEPAQQLSDLEVVGTDDSSEDALFEVRRADGQTVFAVYSEGVRVYVPSDPSTKGTKGGFAIGGFDRTKGEITEDYMYVTPDSIRMYIDKTPGIKGPKGGFAIGGFDRTKAIVDDYMIVNADSTRFYIEDPSVKGLKGGFAIGGFDRTKDLKGDYLRISRDSARVYVSGDEGFAVEDIESGSPVKYMDMTPENYFIGHESGGNNQTGKYNSFIGFRSGISHEDGDYNVLIGYETGLNQVFGIGNTFVGSQSGRRMTSGEFNTYIGYKAGYNNLYAEANTFIGGLAGENNDDGSANTFVGLSTGRSNMTGSQNTFIGSYSGQDNTSGSWNTFLGEHSGVHNQDGNYNVYIGSDAGLKNTNGNENVFLGESSGLWNTGSNNVFIGHEAGFWETSSNKLYITNSAGSDLLDGRNNALLYGDFINSYLIINSQLGVNVDPGSDALRIMGTTGLYGNTGINAPPKTNYSLYVEADGDYSLQTQGYNYLNGNVGVNHTPDSRYGMVVEGGTSASLYVNGDIITQASKVGINHGAPTHTLHVNGTLRAGNSALSSRALELNQLGSGDRSTYIDLVGDDNYGDYGLRLIRYGGEGSNSMLKHRGTGALYIMAEDNGAIRFNTNGTNWMEIEPNGLIGIGHTSPSYKLHVLERSRVDHYAAMIQHNGGSYRYHGLRIAAGATGSSSSNTYMIDFRDGDFTNVGSIALRDGTIHFNTSSDRRLKTNINIAKLHGLETLKNIPVVNFEYREAPGSIHTGFIAQDVQKVFPEAVSEGQEGYLQLAYPSLIPVLAKAIQEQDIVIENLKEEIEHLKQENDEIEYLKEEIRQLHEMLRTIMSGEK